MQWQWQDALLLLHSCACSYAYMCAAVIQIDIQFAQSEKQLHTNKYTNTHRETTRERMREIQAFDMVIMCLYYVFLRQHLLLLSNNGDDNLVTIFMRSVWTIEWQISDNKYKVNSTNLLYIYIISCRMHNEFVTTHNQPIVHSVL